jgi:hypothetical protein
MRPILIRILKQGIPVALILAVVGYVMAESAGMWFAMQAGGDSSLRVTVGDADPVPAGNGGQDLTRILRTRLPLTLAAWGFGIIAVAELLLGLWRRRKPTAPAVPAVPTEDETEKLLNQLLEQADASRAKATTDTPPPAAPCPVPQASENSPVNN